MIFSNDRDKVFAAPIIRNDARRAPLSGRPCIRQYHSDHDTDGLVDKSTYRRMHEEKWGGAPWLEDSETDKSVIVLDNAPPSCPVLSTSVSPTSRASSSQASSRRATLEERYRSHSGRDSL